jgi:EmrB/QacA subfamily drug resistance transporter
VADAGAPAIRSQGADLTTRRRVAALATVCVSLMVITIDVTILNVALPTLATALDADTSALQWFINGYELVFAGLLLTAGALADRYGRRRVLTIGLAVFGAASAACALSGSASELIAARVAMGVGGALVLPATLSIVTNVFTEPAARARAIAVWAGVAALGLGLGPLVGGWLLERFDWGSVFVVNIPVVIAAIVAGRVTIPESRAPKAGRLDPAGAGLSVAGLSALLYAITEGPGNGWSSPNIIAAFAVAGAAIAAFVAWEMRAEAPMLDLGFFSDPRFTVAIAAIAALFFGLFGLMFISTQALQSVMGYDAFAAGVRLVPLPAMFVVFAQISVRLAARVGTRPVVTAGLAIAAVGLATGATLDAGSGYGVLALALSLTGIGMGCTMAPATESIMGSVPPQRAAVASAVNDAARLTAGAIGVAVVGSLLSAAYHPEFAGRGLATLPADASAQAETSIANAAAVAHQTGGTSGDQILAIATRGFLDGASTGLLVAAGVATLGAIVAWRYLPPRMSPTPANPTAATRPLDDGADPGGSPAFPRSDGLDGHPRRDLSRPKASACPVQEAAAEGVESLRTSPLSSLVNGSRPTPKGPEAAKLLDRRAGDPRELNISADALPRDLPPAVDEDNLAELLAHPIGRIPRYLGHVLNSRARRGQEHQVAEHHPGTENLFGVRPGAQLFVHLEHAGGVVEVCNPLFVGPVGEPDAEEPFDLCAGR